MLMFELTSAIYTTAPSSPPVLAYGWFWNLTASCFRIIPLQPRNKSPGPGGAKMTWEGLLLFGIELALVNEMLRNVVMNKVNASKIRCMMPRLDGQRRIKIRLCKGSSLNHLWSHRYIGGSKRTWKEGWVDMLLFLRALMRSKILDYPTPTDIRSRYIGGRTILKNCSQALKKQHCLAAV